MAKETPNDKRLRKEEELKDLTAFGIYQKREQLGTNPFKKNYANKIKEQQEEYYGTSLGRGAEYAGKEARKESVKKQLERRPYATVGETQDEADKAERQAQREAAAEERRESRGMKKGGVVKSSASKRADGCATKGKTRGKMI